MNCEHCGKRISQIRLKALPHTTTCVRCSRELPYAADVVIDPAERTPTRVVPVFHNSGGRGGRSEP